MLLNYTRLNNNRGWLRALIAAAVPDRSDVLWYMLYSCAAHWDPYGWLCWLKPRSYLGQSVCRDRGIACKDQGGARSQSAAAGSLGLSDKALTLQ